jgi:hypothetical protein
MSDEDLYQAIWETAIRYLGEGPESDALTNEIWELVLIDSRDHATQCNRAKMAGFIMGKIWGS